MKIKLVGLVILATVAIFGSLAANAAWVSTGFTDVNIRMDNGVTFFYPAVNGSLSYPLGGSCLYNRLQLNDTGDRFNSVENGRRMMALILGRK